MPNQDKTRVAVIYGGTNTEHEVSIVSARSIISNLNPKKYLVLPVLITKDNQWQAPANYLTPSKIDFGKLSFENGLKQPLFFSDSRSPDIVFPVLHGPFGEDGTIQGLLEMLKLPYVGCGVLSSAVCMDKVIQKQICQKLKIPVADYVYFSRSEWLNDRQKYIDEVESKIKYPVFVKPANQGSSVGVVKVKDRSDLPAAVEMAFELDLKVVVEQAVNNAREIECAVLGNDDPSASVLGEIIPSNEFYDYDAKYIDGKSLEVIPAKLPKNLAERMRQAAIVAFKALNGSGLARADFLLEKGTSNYYLNELNTMPGFTSISMYPKLWQQSGKSYSELLNDLIQLGFERFKERQSINLNFQPKKDWHETSSY